MSRSQGSPPAGSHPNRRTASGQEREPARAPHNPYPNLPPLNGNGADHGGREPTFGRPPDPNPQRFQEAPEPQYHYPPQAQQGYAPQRQPAFGAPPQQPAAYGVDPYGGVPYPQMREPEPVGYAPQRPEPYRGAPQPQQYAPPALDPRLDLRGTQYDQSWPPQGHAPAPPPHDPVNYDLGAYAAPQGYGAPQRPPMPPQATLAGAAARQHQAPSYDDALDEQWEQPQGAPLAYQDARGTQVQAVAEDDEPYDDEFEYEDEEPRGGGRKWIYFAALLIAIAVGGGMAFVYKKFMVADSSAGKTPVVRASKEPQKVAPTDAGGKKFAGSDSRYLGRLEQDGPQGAAAQAETDANGVRRVQTLAVSRDGSLGAPAPVLPPQASGGAMALPGAIFDGPPRQQQQQQQQAYAPPPRLPDPPQVQRSAPPPAPPRQPQVIARAAPTDASEIAPPIQPAAKAPAVPKQPVAKIPPQAQTASTGSSGATSGFVCVLASVGTRMDALKRFADMQQKYPILADKVPEVKEVDLSARGLGTMYRLMAGPSAAKDTAASVCSQLKAAGLPGDPWVTAY